MRQGAEAALQAGHPEGPAQLLRCSCCARHAGEGDAVGDATASRGRYSFPVEC